MWLVLTSISTEGSNFKLQVLKSGYLITYYIMLRQRLDIALHSFNILPQCRILHRHHSKFQGSKFKLRGFYLRMPSVCCCCSNN